MEAGRKMDSVSIWASTAALNPMLEVPTLAFSIVSVAFECYSIRRFTTESRFQGIRSLQVLAFLSVDWICKIHSYCRGVDG